MRLPSALHGLLPIQMHFRCRLDGIFNLGSVSSFWLDSFLIPKAITVATRTTTAAAMNVSARAEVVSSGLGCLQGVRVAGAI